MCVDRDIQQGRNRVTASVCYQARTGIAQCCRQSRGYREGTALARQHQRTRGQLELQASRTIPVILNLASSGQDHRVPPGLSPGVGLDTERRPELTVLCYTVEGKQAEAETTRICMVKVPRSTCNYSK